MKKYIVLFFNILFFSLISFSQNGNFFTINYSPIQYNGESQIWTIAQDKNGVMYFGSNQNIITFDGTNWDKIALGNSVNAIRSIGIDKSGKIFVGSVGNFGYLEFKKNGSYKFVSLLNLVDTADRNFTDIWTLQIQGDNVYFCANEALFRYNSKTKTLFKIKPDYTFFLTYKVRNEIFVTVRGKGLKKIIGDSIVDVPMGNKIGAWIMLPYDDDKYLINSGNGLMVYNPQSKNKDEILTKKFFNQNEIKKTDKFLTEQQPYLGAAYLGNDKYALSTIRSGIVIINKKGKILKVINKNAGLNSETVQFLFLDNAKQLWAGLSYGISHVEIYSPFEYFDEKNGVDGSFYHVFRIGNMFYSSTNLGLFYWENNKFEPIDELCGENAIQVFNPISFSYDNKEKLNTVTTVYGLFKLNGKNVEHINNIVPSSIIQSRFDSSKTWISSNYDLYLGDLNNELKSPEKIFTFKYLINVFGEKNKDEIWLIADEKPILFNIKTKKITYFDKNNEIENIKFYACDFINGKNLFFTNNGFYIYNLKKFSPYNNFIDNITYGKDITQFEKISDNEYWLNYAVDEKSKLAILKKIDGKFVFDSIPFKRFHKIDQFYNDGDSLMWIISSQRIFSFRPDFKTNYNVVNNVLIRKIKLNDSLIFDGLDFKNWFKKNNNIELEYKNNDISFYFSLPDFSNPEGITYSYMLKGGKKSHWSDWTNQNYKEYSNLHEGKYSFLVRAKNIYGSESKKIEFDFTILPPWYRSVFAFILYFFIFLFIIWLAIKINSIRMKKENERLDRIVKERTAELNLQKEEIKTQSENLIEINSLLTERNEEVNQQNEEISAIADSLKEANEKIKEKNKYITDSINYAERIQKAILPSEELYKKLFSEYFIFYQPKDIISGDFYWLKKMDNYILIAVADCTGHGVPGGFISMLSVSLLNELVRRKDISSPKKLLEELRKLVKLALKQDDQTTKQFDGFDLAFVEINTDTEILTYSGAYRPLYLIRNKELTVYKAVLNPIGYFPFEKPFKEISVRLEKGDILYLFSDGYKDQLSPKNRTFGSKKFKENLLEFSNEKVNVQKQNLLDKLLEWKQNKKQTDDILVVGIRW